MTHLYRFFIAALLSCSLLAEVTPTENFIAYLSVLLEQNTVGDDELVRLIEAADKNLVVNPITEEKSQTLVSLQIVHQAFGQILDGVDASQVGAWAREHLQEKNRVREKREEKDEETKFPWKPQPSLLSAGKYRTCAVQGSNFKLVCWGDNYVRQTNVPADLGEVKSVSVGETDTCAVKADDTLVCWGFIHSVYCHVPITLAPVRSVSAGRSHVCAIKAADSTLICWGGDYVGQSTVPPALGEVESVSAGYISTCAVKAVDFAVVCWGAYDIERDRVLLTLGPVYLVSVGYEHACAVKKADSTVVCWGENRHKQRDVPSDLGPVHSVSAGKKHTCAVKLDDTVTCWGSNEDNRSTPPAGLKVKRIEVTP